MKVGDRIRVRSVMKEHGWFHAIVTELPDRGQPYYFVNAMGYHDGSVFDDKEIGISKPRIMSCLMGQGD